MDLNQLITEINELSDEQETPSIIVGFVNDAIAKVNIECDASFPSISVSDASVTFLPEKWIRTLFIPFGVGRVKQRDSSEFEFSNAYSEFLVNLQDFKAKYTIPDEYLDASNSTTSGDVLTAPSWNYGGW